MKISSPNFNDRAQGIALTYIILHYTGMKDAQSALTRLCDPTAQVSTHTMIDEDGQITQLIDEDKRAWHAGKSSWRGLTDINSASIGIELVNPGHEFGYRPFPAAQITALKELLREMIARHDMKPRTCLLAHSDIAPQRKQDPGELFPWQELAREGLGLWPAPQAQDYAAFGETEIASTLGLIGYDTSATASALRAFQRRFYPENITGIADRETAARLRSVKRQWGA